MDLISAPFDEFRDGAGAVRPHWRRFADLLNSLPVADFERRKQSAARAIRDNGPTYNVYDENESDRRAAQFDLVPLLLSQEDWAEITKGLVQRAALAEDLLSDIYGPQRLIAEGLLPPALVLGNPQFLRPLAGMAAKNPRLHLFALDLARDQDGHWRVLQSFADIPRGLGQVLENRLMASQSLPEAFAEIGVARLRPFLRGYRDQILAQRARRGRAVLLTPGPHHPAYFEQVFLAHYLGLTVVEGDDMAVRDRALFLKSLTGLERVGALFRRVESDLCDPLELRGDSLLGVPNLVQVARDGAVLFANGLGAAVIEAPALEAVLPDLCRALKNENVRLQGPATFWCGDERGKARRDAPDMRLRSAFNAEKHVDGGERRGELLIMQRPVQPSLAPCFDDGFHSGGALTLRVFAARTREGWTAMPGGLVQLRGEGEAVLTKDCWIATAGGPEHVLGQSAPEIAREGQSAPSRALDNLFWLGRYVERSEGLTRILRAITARLGENPVVAFDLMARLAAAAPEESGETLSAKDSEAALTAELEQLIFGQEGHRGLQQLLAQVEEAAWAVRDRLSLDTWRTVRVLTAKPPEAENGFFDAAGAMAYLDALVRRSAALAGLAGENMTRGPTWLFLELGRRIERASHLAWLVERNFAQTDEGEIERMRAVLEIADSDMTYRSRYLNRFALAPILDLSLLDAANPRSVAFQLAAIRRHLSQLPRVTSVQRAFVADRLAEELETQIAAAQPEWLAEIVHEQRETLGELCRQLRSGAASLSDALADAYFQHANRHRTGSAARIGIH